MSWLITPRLVAPGPTITTAKIFATWPGGTRAANYTVAYSDNNSTWTDAFSGVMTSTTCGLFTGSGTGDGSYGGHPYWRYVVGAATLGHHPRVARIVLASSTTDFLLVKATDDNCSDIGLIPNFGGAQSTFVSSDWRGLS